MARPHLVAAYIDALGLCAATVRTAPAGPFCKMGFTTEFRVPGAGRAVPDLMAELWFAKASHAELVIARCRSDFREVGVVRPQGWLDLPEIEVIEKIEVTARLLGAPWRTSAQIVDVAEDAVSRIEAKVDALRQNGGLKDLNRTYKNYRQAQVARGETAMPYGKFLKGFVSALTCTVARNVATNSPTNFGAIDAGLDLLTGPALAAGLIRVPAE